MVSQEKVEAHINMVEKLALSFEGRVTQEIDAENEEDALGIFWDDMNRAQCDEELANIEQVK